MAIKTLKLIKKINYSYIYLLKKSKLIKNKEFMVKKIKNYIPF